MQQKLTQIQEMWISPAHLLFVQKAASSLGSCWFSSHVHIRLIYNIYNIPSGQEFVIECVHAAVVILETRSN